MFILLVTAGQQFVPTERQARYNELDLERQNEQNRLDVTTAYYSLQNSDQQARIYEAAVINAQQSLRDAQNLERAGVGTKFDVLSAQVQLANQIQSLTNAKRDQRTNQRLLGQLLNLPQSANVTAADPVQIAGIWELSLEDSIVLAYKNRAELEQLLVQGEIAEQNRRIAISAISPQVSVFFDYNVSDAFDDSLRPVNGYSLGARLQWNLFDGGNATYSAAQSEVDQAIAQANFAQERNQVRVNVESSFFNLQANFENIQTARLGLDQAKEALRLARLRFKAGVGTQTDVINSETSLSTAEGNLVQAIIGYNQALASLQRYISNLPLPPNTTTP